MAGDLAEIEQLAGALLRSVSASERRRLLRHVARDLQKSQSARIARQIDPDGNAYPASSATASYRHPRPMPRSHPTTSAPYRLG
jgi:phage virion morphogenesis protein